MLALAIGGLAGLAVMADRYKDRRKFKNSCCQPQAMLKQGAQLAGHDVRRSTV
jgi:hypothetical protein